jgi:hypothetical protein
LPKDWEAGRVSSYMRTVGSGRAAIVVIIVIAAGTLSLSASASASPVTNLVDTATKTTSDVVGSTAANVTNTTSPAPGNGGASSPGNIVGQTAKQAGKTTKSVTGTASGTLSGTLDKVRKTADGVRGAIDKNLPPTSPGGSSPSPTSGGGRADGSAGGSPKSSAASVARPNDGHGVRSERRERSSALAPSFGPLGPSTLSLVSSQAPAALTSSLAASNSVNSTGATASSGDGSPPSGPAPSHLPSIGAPQLSSVASQGLFFAGLLAVLLSLWQFGGGLGRRLVGPPRQWRPILLADSPARPG